MSDQDGNAHSNSDENSSSDASIRIEKIEGENVNIGDITGGDKTTVSDVQDSAVAIGRGSAAANRGGIAISGNVGGDLVISVGNRELALPLSVQFTIGFIALAVTFLVIAVGYNTSVALAPTPTPTFTPTPTPTFTPTPVNMTGDFNIAVAQFHIDGEDEMGFEAAQELAQSFANAIKSEIAELAGEIYGSQIVEVRSPQEIGTIEGKSVEERAENARVLARKIKADVVIYGNIKVDGLTAIIIPEFYVVDKDFNDAAAEMTGQYRIGSELLLDKIDNRRIINEAQVKLKNRFRTLTFVIYGLADFVAGAYKDAEIKFNKALEIKAWDNPDVILVMLGNAAIKQNELDKAEQYYSNARDVNPDYARAYAGLANVFMYQAQPKDETTYGFNIMLLDLAIDNYQKALDSQDQPPLADIPTKVNFGLGEVYLRKALIEKERNDSKARDHFYNLARQSYQVVIQEFESGNERVRELTAQAHARLGLIHRLNEQREAAIIEYTQAIKLLPDYGEAKKLKAYYQQKLDELQ